MNGGGVDNGGDTEEPRPDLPGLSPFTVPTDHSDTKVEFPHLKICSARLHLLNGEGGGVIVVCFVLLAMVFFTSEKQALLPGKTQGNSIYRLWELL